MRSSVLRALLPVLLLALHTLWCGTLFGGLSAAARACAALSLLGMSLLGARHWRDPLGVGGGSVLLLTVATLLSTALSPVSRAGLEAAVLMPALLLLPAATAGCWRGTEARRWGLRGLSLLVAVVSVWSLVELCVRRMESGVDATVRAAAPLGHHNLQSLWLLALWPLAVAPVAERGRWRVLAMAIGMIAVLSTALTGSLAASAALAVQILVLVSLRLRRLWLVGIGVAAVLGIAQLPRLLGILAADDASVLARWAYLGGSWRGVVERPLLGWGPGSSRWVFGEGVRSVPGITPAGEVVTDPHSLALLVLFELGLVGFALTLVLGVRFGRRWLRLGAPERQLPDQAAGVGLLGLLLASLAGNPTSVSAVVVAAGVVVGVVLRLPQGATRPSCGWAVPIYAGVAAVLLLRPMVASWEYERALGNSLASAERMASSSVQFSSAVDTLFVGPVPLPPPLQLTAWVGEMRHFEAEALRSARHLAATEEHLRRAVELDPSFPLYLARSGWLRAQLRPGSPEAALNLVEAARAAHGLAPLWLAAGLLGYEVRADWAQTALLRACELDPLQAAAPFYLMLLEPDPETSVSYGARAVLADPRLAAERSWELIPGHYAAVRQRLQGWPGLDAGWHRQLLDELAVIAEEGGRSSDARLSRTVVVDDTPSTSLSVLAFRRLPWPASAWGGFELGSVEVDAGALARITVPSAAQLRETAPLAFAGADCASP